MLAYHTEISYREVIGVSTMAVDTPLDHWANAHSQSPPRAPALARVGVIVAVLVPAMASSFALYISNTS